MSKRKLETKSIIILHQTSFGEISDVIKLNLSTNDENFNEGEYEDFESYVDECMENVQMELRGNTFIIDSEVFDNIHEIEVQEQEVEY
jgi:hypothetical protein